MSEVEKKSFHIVYNSDVRDAVTEHVQANDASMIFGLDAVLTTDVYLSENELYRIAWTKDVSSADYIVPNIPCIMEFISAEISYTNEAELGTKSFIKLPFSENKVRLMKLYLEILLRRKAHRVLTYRSLATIHFGGSNRMRDALHIAMLTDLGGCLKKCEPRRLLVARLEHDPKIPQDKVFGCLTDHVEVHGRTLFERLILNASKLNGDGCILAKSIFLPTGLLNHLAYLDTR